jgi:hypothetical protein
LHRFVASDPGRGLHNHPWKHALSLVLSGTYEETRMLDSRADNVLHSRWLRPGRFNFISGDIFHRVNIPQDRECWSLFVHAPKAKSWGFSSKNTWIITTSLPRIAIHFGGSRPVARFRRRRCACPARYRSW